MQFVLRKFTDSERKLNEPLKQNENKMKRLLTVRKQIEWYQQRRQPKM